MMGSQAKAGAEANNFRFFFFSGSATDVSSPVSWSVTLTVSRGAEGDDLPAVFDGSGDLALVIASLDKC